MAYPTEQTLSRTGGYHDYFDTTLAGTDVEKPKDFVQMSSLLATVVAVRQLLSVGSCIKRHCKAFDKARTIGRF